MSNTLVFHLEIHLTCVLVLFEPALEQAERAKAKYAILCPEDDGDKGVFVPQRFSTLSTRCQDVYKGNLV